MSTVTDSFVVVCGIVLAAGALLYGCVHVRPGSIVRWGVFAGCAVVATQFGWLPLLSLLGIRATSVADQYGALQRDDPVVKVVDGNSLAQYSVGGRGRGGRQCRLTWKS